MVSYWFLQLFINFLRLVPFRALYVLSDGLAFLLYRVVGYRKKVIFDNLKRAFPEKSDNEIKEIAWENYQNLLDVSLETLKTFTVSIEEVRRRCRVVNPEVLSAVFENGKSVILAGSHVGNWEYAALSIPGVMPARVYGAYKPLSNKYIDPYLTQNRAKGSITPIAMDEMFGQLRKARNILGAYMLIADQSPSSRKRAHWLTFFGQETACLPGVEVLSRTFGYPVFAYRIHRVRRGFYEVTFHPLCDDPATFAEGDITRAYMQGVETEIRENPGHWLWSHKRWKMKKEQEK